MFDIIQLWFFVMLNCFICVKLCREIGQSWPQFHNFLVPNRSSYSEDFRWISATAMTKDDDVERRDVSRPAAFYCYIQCCDPHLAICVRWFLFFLVRQRLSRTSRRYWGCFYNRRDPGGGLTSKAWSPERTKYLPCHREGETRLNQLISIVPHTLFNYYIK